MRIGPYTQIQQLYNTTQTAKTSKTQKKGFSDAVSISSTGKDIQTAKAAVAAAPDIRKDLTDSIKGKIDAGTYEVSADSFADKLFEKINQSSFAL
jgi:negative regulator of flagellin synthesis FlgM